MIIGSQCCCAAKILYSFRSINFQGILMASIIFTTVDKFVEDFKPFFCHQDHCHSLCSFRETGSFKDCCFTVMKIMTVIDVICFRIYTVMKIMTSLNYIFLSEHKFCYEFYKSTVLFQLSGKFHYIHMLLMLSQISQMLQCFIQQSQIIMFPIFCKILFFLHKHFFLKTIEKQGCCCWLFV